MDEESFITSRFTGLISFMKLANETSQRAERTVTRRPEKFASLLFKSAHHWVSRKDIRVNKIGRRVRKMDTNMAALHDDTKQS